MRILLAAAFVLASPGSLLSQERGPLEPEVRRDAPPADASDPGDPPDRWLGPDKAMHAFAGFWTAASGHAAIAALDGDRGDRRAGALAAGAVAGLAKEVFDAAVQGERFSWKDLAADAVGIAALLGLVVAVE